MDNEFFGFHAIALQHRSNRNEILARNLAHADTPGFQARDLDFAEVLAATESPTTLRRTHSTHLAANSNAMTDPALKYRIPTQPSVDGNTVETDVEQAAFAENVVQYQASLQFINGKIRTLRHAISGERS
ncbi:MAG: flagellar basal body rod protein FlgB [Pseudomonadota bacterium]